MSWLGSVLRTSHASLRLILLRRPDPGYFYRFEYGIGKKKPETKRGGRLRLWQEIIGHMAYSAREYHDSYF